MTRHLFIIAAALLATGPADARMFGSGGDAGAVFDNADANHDGIITRAEFVAARNARFRTMDRNGDGAISKADFGRIAKFRPDAAARLDAMIAQADADHDGKVTAAELAAAPVPIFERIDTNHDGAVDQAELAAGKAALATLRDRGK